MKKLITMTILTLSISLSVVGCGKKTALGKYHEESVNNGLGEEIGTRLVVNSNNKNITDENIIKFYNETVKDNDYKYITVDLGNGEGLVFNNDNFFIKGKIDENGMISNTEKLGQIEDNKIIYKED